MSEAATGVQRGIKRMRIIRAVIVLTIALNAFIFAVDLAAGSSLAFVPPVMITALLAVIAMQTRLIGTLRRQERELNRPHMTVADYRHLREMEIELGWEPSEVPASVAELAPGFTPPPALTLPVTGMTTMADFETGIARLSATLSGTGTPSAPMTGPGGRWHPVNELPEMQQAGDGPATEAKPEGIPAAPLIENMREELEAQRWLDEDRRERP
jgi:hypothetical protein